MSYRHSALRESALACVVYDDSPVLDCKDSENQVKCKINCDLFSFSRCILSSPRVKDSTFFSIIATFPQHFLPFLLWTGQKDRPKGNPSTKKEVSVDFLCYFILLQLLSPTFKNVSFYQINNRLVTISSDKVHELLVAISIYNNRSIREPRYLMAYHISIKHI